MEKQIVNIDLLLQPDTFHPDVFYDQLLEQVKKREMLCDQKIGYIDQIFRIVDLRGMRLLDDGSCQVQASVECNVFKPSIDQEITVNVVMISEHGIFSELGKNKFLVPANKIDSQFEFKNYIFQSKNNPLLQIKKNDQIRVKICDYRYDHNKGYCCIASLI